MSNDRHDRRFQCALDAISASYSPKENVRAVIAALDAFDACEPVTLTVEQLSTLRAHARNGTGIDLNIGWAPYVQQIFDYCWSIIHPPPPLTEDAMTQYEYEPTLPMDIIYKNDWYYCAGEKWIAGGCSLDALEQIVAHRKWRQKQAERAQVVAVSHIMVNAAMRAYKGEEHQSDHPTCEAECFRKAIAAALAAAAQGESREAAEGDLSVWQNDAVY